MSPMNPRLLRPLATGFNPRQIAGCICNLDASVLSSLKQNSDGTTDATANDDPVGYWSDLSGLGNHAVQSVATGSRPLLKLNNQNGRPGLFFDGSDDFLAASVAGFRSLSAATIVQVVKPTAAAAADANTAVFWGFGDGSTAGFSLLSATSVLSGEKITFLINTSTGRVGSSTYNRAASTAQVIATSVSASGVAASASGSPVSFNLQSGVTASTNASPSSLGYTANDNVNLGALLFSGGLVYTPELTLHHVIIYNKVLTTAERQKIEGYLAWKWGLEGQLPTNHPYAYSFPGLGSQPQPSNAESVDWISRVYANGGTVSTSTANAVNTFCDAIDAAGIRDRFYRLNLFCGDSLNAALVPLYRSTSYGGSALGNATDTNNAFVGVGTDYAETGASGGLSGNGSTKYLDTGLTYDAMGVPATMHLAGFKGSGTWSTTTEFMGARDADDLYQIQFRFPSSQLRVSTFAGGASSIINEVAVSSDTSFVVLSRSSSTSHVLYENAVSIGSSAVATTPGGCNRNFLVFTRDDGSGAAVSRWPHRISGYSIGLGLDAAQVSSYNAAMQAFQTALGRNV